MKPKICSKVVDGMYITYTKNPLVSISCVPVHSEFLEKFPRLRAGRKVCAKYRGW